MTNLNLFKIKMKCNPYSKFPNQQYFQKQSLALSTALNQEPPNPVFNSLPGQSLQLSRVRF